MVLFRSAMKQVARRHGHLVSFMCRPALPNVSPAAGICTSRCSTRKSGSNLSSRRQRELLSPTRPHYLGGLLAHARAAAAFTTPTVNGYKRYHGVNSMAPIQAIWAHDNRGVMIRVLGEPGDPSTHLENRVGEPLANPYLYMASQIHAGLDGIAQRAIPGRRPMRPTRSRRRRCRNISPRRSARCTRSAVFRDGFGDAFVDYYAHIKKAEIARFNAESRRRTWPTSPPGSTTSISICFDQRHSGLPRSGKSGIHNHQVSEYGFRARRFAAPRNDDIP